MEGGGRKEEDTDAQPKRRRRARNSTRFGSLRSLSPLLEENCVFSLTHSTPYILEWICIWSFHVYLSSPSYPPRCNGQQGATPFSPSIVEIFSRGDHDLVERLLLELPIHQENLRTY